jgi:hypothetical protein
MTIFEGKFELKGETQLTDEQAGKISSFFSEDCLCTISLVGEDGKVLDERKGKIKELPGGNFRLTEVKDEI